MIKRDFVFEQVEFISKLLYTILFPKQTKGKEFNINDYKFDTTSLELKLRLLDLIKENNFNKAEDLLFESIDNDKGQGSLQVAVWFYLQLNNIDEEVLEKNNFSRQEVLEGIQEIEKIAMNS